MPDPHVLAGPYCPGVWDTILCWPAAKAGTKVYLPCPPLPGLVPESKSIENCLPLNVFYLLAVTIGYRLTNRKFFFLNIDL